jgi:hypothetical protein
LGIGTKAEWASGVDGIGAVKWDLEEKRNNKGNGTKSNAPDAITGRNGGEGYGHRSSAVETAEC